MTQTHLEQVNANRDFREIVDYLGSIRYLHLVPQLIREPDRGGDRSDDPYGADFLLRMAKTPVKTRTRRLHRISQSLRAAVPQLDQLDLVQDEIGMSLADILAPRTAPPEAHDLPNRLAPA